jgi:hypothetical protein
MAAGYHIHYLRQEAIDKHKWDGCVGGAFNHLIYAYSAYLDIMAPGWDALVLNDYEAVMPLPRKNKSGFSYLFQPPITPTLGIFGNAITEELAGCFLAAIPAVFKLWDISLNHFNPLPHSPAYPVYPRNNFVLALNKPYGEIQKGYHLNIKRNISKAISSGCIVKKGVPIDVIIRVAEREFPRFAKVESSFFERVRALYLYYGGQGETYCVLNDKGENMASAAFLLSQGRACYWLVGNDPGGREYGASSLLLDAFIRDHSDKDILLDFEGSDDKGVADFYKKFGSMAEPYTTIYYNKLPFPFRLFKPVPSHYRRLGL